MSAKKQIAAFLLTKYEAALKIGSTVEVPWHVKRILGDNKIGFYADQLCLSDEGDYASLQECREAINWYAEQLGGSIKWKD